MVNCPLCAGPISAGSIDFDGILYHPKCFICKKCNGQCRVAACQKISNKFYCQNCVDKNPDLYHAHRNESKRKMEEPVSKSASKSKSVEKTNASIPKKPKSSTSDDKTAAGGVTVVCCVLM